MADHVLSGYARISLKPPIDILHLVDRNLDLRGAGEVSLESIDLRRDSNIQGSIKGEIELTVSSKKDVVIQGNASINNGFKLEGIAGRDIAHTLVANISEPVLDFTPGIDQSLAIEIELDPLAVEVNSKKDCPVKIYSALEQDLQASIARFERSLLTLPPSGQLFIINSVDLQNSNNCFDGKELNAGVTHILQLEVVGTRLDTYLIEFMAKLDPSDSVPIIHKKSDQVTGGVEVLGVDPIASSSGTSQKLVAQIRLDSNDTSQVKSTTTLFYQVIMSHRALNEEYLVSPQNDETGTFKVLVKKAPIPVVPPDTSRTFQVNRTQISQKGEN